MKTRNETQYQENRRMILANTRKLMKEKGSDKISLRQIAARSGFSPASLYEYFPSKENIFCALAKETEREFIEYLQKFLEKSGDNSIVNLGLAYFHFALEHELSFKIIFSLNRSERHGIAESIPEDSSYHILFNMVAEGIADGSITVSDDPEVVSFGLWSLIHGASVLKLTQLRHFEMNFDRIVTEIIRNYIRG